MLRFVDLLSDIANNLGFYYTSLASMDIDSDTTNYPRLNRIKRLINDAYIHVMLMMPKEFLLKEKIVRIPGVYDTGSVNITQGNVGFDGNGTTWTRYMQGRQIVPAGSTKAYFIGTFTSTTAMSMVQAYVQDTITTENYEIGVWAWALPGDYLSPVDRNAVWNVDDNVAIPMFKPQEFRKAFPSTYQSGTPYACCIEGISPCSMITDVGDVVNGSATVTFDNYAPVHEDVGKTLRLAGDSIPYKIMSRSGATTVTVSPVVQRANGTAIAIDVDPAPLPLLWFDQAPSDDFPILLRYYAKPEYLWTDEQRVALAGEYVQAFKAYANWLVVEAFSADRMQKEEAAMAVQRAFRILPKNVDTAPILKEVNEDVAGWPRITFPNVSLAT